MSDTDRKIELLKYTLSKREQFIKLLVLTKWGKNARKFQQCQVCASARSPRCCPDSPMLKAHLSRETLTHHLPILIYASCRILSDFYNMRTNSLLEQLGDSLRRTRCLEGLGRCCWTVATLKHLRKKIRRQNFYCAILMISHSTYFCKTVCGTLISPQPLTS
jgi:hypothetical protein